MKDIHTLVDDIYEVTRPGTHYPMTLEVLQPALKSISNIMCEVSAVDAGGGYRLRPSNVGKGLRWHWFMNKFPQLAEEFDGRMKMLFQAGHVQEALLLAYIKLSGHEVTHEQGRAELAGISGSCDCVIDGYLIDVKTTSDYSFKKFSEGNINLENDSFGYIAQLATYKAGLEAQGVKLKGQGWLAYNKNNSQLALYLLPDSQLINAEAKINSIKEVHQSDVMPEELCPGAEPKAEPNGNLLMSVVCEFCPFKDKCWPDFKVYRYSNKDKYYVSIKKEPRVEEVTNEYR